MKNLFILLFFGVLFSSYTSEHKYYFSHTEIVHNKESSSFEIATKIFFDDLDGALYEFYGEKLQEGTEKGNEQIFNYLQKNLSITVNENPLELSFLGVEDELDAVWVYLEAKDLPEEIKSVEVKNSVLTEFYPQQTNIINFFPEKGNTKKVKGLILNRNKLTGKIRL